jgi:hypothetical protein
MKTKTIFFLFLIMGIATTQFFAQQPVVVRPKSLLTIKVWPDVQNAYYSGEQVESLQGNLTMYNVLRFKHGNLDWENMCVFNEAENDNANEVFTIRGNDFNKDLNAANSHLNLIRNQGTAYIGSVKWDWLKNLLRTFDKATWSQNK